MRAFLCVLVFALFATAAQAGEPAFDPRALRGDVEGPLTRVLVLGTPHLSEAGAEFDPGVLEPLLERLAAFAPDVVAVENLSGEDAYMLLAYREIYPGVAESFAGRTLALSALARGARGAELPQAEADARRRLEALPAVPTPAERRRLAASFAAAGDPFSALVQWLRLPDAERRRGNGVSGRLARALNQLAAARNESLQIGSALAARAGLERVHPIDDHAADDLRLRIIDTLTEAAARDPAFAALLADPLIRRLSTAAQRLRSPAEALATYREINSAAAVVGDPERQWRYWLSLKRSDRLGRMFVAEWEARNLRMVANLREALASRPGGAAVVIVGSAHKPYFEAYLNLMTDVALVDAETVLR